MTNPVIMSAATANTMIDIYAASQGVPSGVPVPVTNAKAAAELERLGMIERHHLGKGIGALITEHGRAFVRDAIRHLNTQRT